MMKESEAIGQSTKKYIVQHDKQNCIGCAACSAVAPDLWAMNEEGKADIIGDKKKDDELEEIDIDEKDFQTHKDAADSCPVNAIHIVNKKTKEKII